VWQTTFFTDKLNLGDLFGGSWPDITIDYSASSLIYRLCFPVWDGAQTQCDPVYVGYLSSRTIAGDINGDGTVNILDAIILANAFLTKPGDPNWNPNADINSDGVVNILDAIILANHFLQHQ
jgi:hypothetical protein